jgi:hypothetical protein
MDGLTESSARRQGTNERKEDGRDRIINLCLGAQSLIEDALAKLGEEKRETIK